MEVTQPCETMNDQTAPASHVYWCPGAGGRSRASSDVWLAFSKRSV